MQLINDIANKISVISKIKSNHVEVSLSYIAAYSKLIREDILHKQIISRKT